MTYTWRQQYGNGEPLPIYYVERSDHMYRFQADSEADARHLCHLLNQLTPEQNRLALWESVSAEAAE